MTTLAELVEKLPPDIQKEVKDFVGFLLKKGPRRVGIMHGEEVFVYHE